ncbi:MAG TPA: YqgE/AlgH family protein [Burkholderiales bacterium]|jgi:putative AlgH/UPF0301 family transcriptional regulator|nr:YqgE/AlgH family protein [Burkholderiales bacterium]HVJ24304.1 YqgE/AlgH family protein [Burkholderiales bacterium]
MRWLAFVFLVAVILNRPTTRKHEQTGEVIYTGGPGMREVLVALFRAERAPEASAFHVLNDVYLSMHPQNIEMLLQKRGGHYRLFAGFSGWAPGQLECFAPTPRACGKSWCEKPAGVWRPDKSGRILAA